MKRKSILLLVCLLMGINQVIAQVQGITGLVVSEEDGQPVIGASVLVKGTQMGVITDVNGIFSIPNVPSTYKTLVVSFVGMQTQEVPIKPGQIKIILKNSSELLDEVMVVAYGTAKRSAFTGSAAVVSSEKIENIQSSNATSALAGKVAGVQITTSTGQPGAANPTIMVRGISSIRAGVEPLIVVDGVPFDGDLNTINNQDIESMTVLKDAASNALYGARGANGVIMITTKKGSKGDAKVTLDVKFGINNRAVKEYNTVTNPGLYYEMYYGALNSYFRNNQSMSEEEAYITAVTNMTNNGSYGLGYNVFSLPKGQYLIGRNGKMNPNATLGNVVNYHGKEYLLTADDWLDAAYSNGLRQEYNVSVSTGSDRGVFYASFNYLDNEGITKNSNFQRLVGRLKADYQVKDWLKVGANMSFTHYDADMMSGDGDSGSSGNILAFASYIAPIYPLYIRDGQGNHLYDEYGLKLYDYGNGGNAGSKRPFLTNSNAYQALELEKNNSEGNAFTASGFAEIRFLNDFKFTSNNNVSVDETRGTGTTNPYYGQYASSNGMVNKTHARQLTYNYQQLLNYKHSFGHHNVEALLGHEFFVRKYYLLNAQRSNQLIPSNSELSGAITDGSSNSYFTHYNVEGYFSRVQYDYDEKYFGSASFRRDASSRFHPDNRWGNFWSFSGAWMINKESWFNVDWVDEFKLKASYGSQGNDNIGSYRYTNTYEFTNGDGQPAVKPGDIEGNKNITWETNANFNVGLEFSVLKNRLSGSVEFFNRKTLDMLFTVPNAPSYAYGATYANVGDMRNLGVEVELNGTLIRTKDLTWDMSLNLTHYKNEISYLSDEHKIMTVDGVSGYSSGSFFYGEGKPLYTYRLKKYAGVSAYGEALYYKNKKDVDGNIVGRVTTTDYSSADYYLCETALPDLYGGFGTSISYKGFDLSADFAYQIGGMIYDSDYAALMASPVDKDLGKAFHADLLDAWTPERHTNTPRFQFGDEFSNASSDRFLTNASYLSLQNITLGYNLPKNICRNLFLDKVRVYATCENVWIWSKRQGLDPRQSITGSSAANYAPIRTITGGLSVTF